MILQETLGAGEILSRAEKVLDVHSQGSTFKSSEPAEGPGAAAHVDNCSAGDRGHKDPGGS